MAPTPRYSATRSSSASSAKGCPQLSTVRAATRGRLLREVLRLRHKLQETIPWLPLQAEPVPDEGVSMLRRESRVRPRPVPRVRCRLRRGHHEVQECEHSEGGSQAPDARAL